MAARRRWIPLAQARELAGYADRPKAFDGWVERWNIKNAHMPIRRIPTRVDAISLEAAIDALELEHTPGLKRSRALADRAAKSLRGRA